MIKYPAEWYPQSFVQFTFPHENSDWKEMLPEVTDCFIELISVTSLSQDVLVICDDINRVQAFFKSNPKLHFVQIPSNDTWARDHGGITVLKDNNAVVLDFIFNGWGNKYNADFDNEITGHLYKQKIINCHEYQPVDFVLEGGSIESDGKGTILTTSKCLLEKNRNPMLTKKKIENVLKQRLGAERILWLNSGYIAGDDTDSHIDTLARFCNEKTIAYVGCNNPNDEHYKELQQMKNELKQFTDFKGNPYKLVELPIPDICKDTDGNRLPASYANFLIINKAVLVPTYGVKQDEHAIQILKTIFTDREIISIDCRILIEQHGSLHCATMQYPKPVRF